MAKTPTAVFAQTPMLGQATFNAAIGSLNTGAPTNLAQACVMGADGGLITAVSVMPRGTVTATSVLLFVSIDGGVTKLPIDSVLVAAYTNVTTAKRVKTNFTEISEAQPIRLPANAIVYLGTEVATTDQMVGNVQYTNF